MLIAVFQLPTLVFFLERMRLVTAGFLWRHVKYAVLISFIVAAVLTPSPDPWNQTAFAGPMIGMYVISIGIAWIVASRRRGAPTGENISRNLKLVFAASLIDQVTRRGDKSRTEFPRLWRQPK